MMNSPSVHTIILLLIFMFVSSGTARAVPSLNEVFTEVPIDIPGVSGGDMEWGDYDGDGDLDILLGGEDLPYHNITRIYRNDGNGDFNAVGAGLLGLNLCSLSWGDYDGDGDLDILATGQFEPYNLVTKIYRNDGGVFFDIDHFIPGVMSGSAEWGDFDNDGDLDILIAGYSDYGFIGRIYRNAGNDLFVNSGVSLPGVWFSDADWGDYDNDGDLDFLLMGDDGSGSEMSRIYRNDGNGDFTDIRAGIIQLSHGSIDWGDYDNDGDLDFIIEGLYGLYNGESAVRIYRNDGQDVFTDIAADLFDAGEGSVQWGDYDNDGDLDFLLTGWKNMAGYVTKVYTNEGEDVFSELPDSLAGLMYPASTWGDYDSDGDLDFILTGMDWTGMMMKLYRNDGGFPSNHTPTVPGGITEVVRGDSVTMVWKRAADTETPSPGLTYNLRLGRLPGGVDVVSPMADPILGVRWIVSRGNTCHDTTWTVQGLSPGLYHWSVQSIDTGFKGSKFSPDGSFWVLTPPAARIPSH